LQSPPLGWPDLLRALDAIAPERHPRSPEAWQAFSLLYTEALHAWRVVHMLNIGLGQRFMVEVLRPWLARVGRDWEAAATRWRDGFRRVDGLHVASAWGQDLKVLLGSPRLSPPLRQPLVEALARAPLSIWQRMVEEREAWQAPIQPAAPQPAAGALAAFGWQRCLLLVGEWPAECRAGPWHRLTDELVLDVGLPISPLNGEAVLQRESGVMQHCIHTYTRQLLSRSQLAFALGADGHADRSTVLVQCNRAADGRWHVQIKQHRAVRNRLPSEACEAAVRRLTDRLMASDAREAMDRVEHARILRLQTLGSLGIAEEPTWLVSTRAAAAREAERVAAVALIASRAWHVLRRVKLLDEECGP